MSILLLLLLSLLLLLLLVEALLTIFYYSKRQVYYHSKRVLPCGRCFEVYYGKLCSSKLSWQQRKHEREIYYNKLIFTILKPGFINGLSKLCLLWCQDVMYFEKFRPVPMNSRMQTFECVGHLILHDLDLSSNEKLSVDLYTPYSYCIKWMIGT